MQAYMKTEMPYFGIKAPARRQIFRDLRNEIVVDSPDVYVAFIETLWSGDHREHKYLALDFARRFFRHAEPAHIELFRSLAVEGAWWDLVDDLATHMIGPLARRHPDELWPIVDAWIDHDDMWLRRTAMLSQVGAKDETDDRRLFTHALVLAAEKEFFIRKAIGWALRDRSYTNPDGVNEFLDTHWDELSGLTRREGAKALIRNGLRT